MKPPPLKYARPDDLSDVLTLLEQHGDEAKLLAGGQSLMPMLNFRLIRPSVLIDLGAVGGMDSLTVDGGTLIAGAMVRQTSAKQSHEVSATTPLVVQALRHVGHLQIRNRGTIGGSLAHAAPAAELPAVALILDAEMVLRNSRADRIVHASDFYRGPFTTAANPDEVLTEIRFHNVAGSRTTFLELARRAGDFALAGVAALARVGSDARTISEARLVAIGVSGEPMRLSEAEAVITGAPCTQETFLEAGVAAARQVTTFTDLHATAEYRKEMLAVLVSRALSEVAAPWDR